MQPQPSVSFAQKVIEAEDIGVRYGDVSVLDGVHIRVSAASTFVILGDSGCGKTTLLKVLAGNIAAHSGRVFLRGRRLQEVAMVDRGILYLDQEALLFEHLNVYENVAFALRLKKTNSDVIEAKVQQILGLISLSEHASKKSHQLSGGQKQRVTFARAVLAEPQVLLLDEPFCSLDDRTRGVMQELYRKLCAEFHITAVFVTHDVKEALLVGDTYGYMYGGKLHTYASQEEFMQDPRTGVRQEIDFWKSVQSRDPR
jgi:putrescine transport system ATP-binding protein